MTKDESTSQPLGKLLGADGKEIKIVRKHSQPFGFGRDVSVEKDDSPDQTA